VTSDELVRRSSYWLRPDSSRVISRLFVPGSELVGGSEYRTTETVERVLALGDDEVATLVRDLASRFGARHADIISVWEEHARRVEGFYAAAISRDRRRLIGAAFTHEFSLEGSSVCNPSLVEHPSQSGVPEGGLRVVMSYRAIGEGHLSSVEFRSGLIDARGTLILDDPEPHPVVGARRDAPLDRTLFEAKMRDAGLDGETATWVLGSLGAQFTPGQLHEVLTEVRRQRDTRQNVDAIAQTLQFIASCCYAVHFYSDTALSRRVLWPATLAENRGIEDARFVRFHDTDHDRYLATYTAFDGVNVTQQLLETENFIDFSSTPLAGEGAKNKGMAFFPRKIRGEYVALSRHDRESNAVTFSLSLHQWDRVVTIQSPRLGWEVIQLGNCGSPVELDEGWLVIIHGVGPMRTYGIGALLLDLEDPTKVLARLEHPLMTPDETERDGYVPNVLYSCGSLLHRRTLYLPYAASDQAISFATVAVDEVLAAMTYGPLPS